MSRLLFAAQDPGAIQAITPVLRAVGQLPSPPARALLVSDRVDATSLRDAEGCRIVHGSSAETLTRLMAELRPTVLISGSSAPDARSPTTPEQHLVRLANERGITSMMILDFWGIYAERFADWGGSFDPAYVPTKICALDELSKKSLLALGIDAGRVVVTHNPYYDAVVAEARGSGGGGPHPAHPARDPVQVVFISQPHAQRGRRATLGYDQFSNFAALLDGLALWPTPAPKDVNIWIHPMEPRAPWDALIGEKSAGEKGVRSIAVSGARDAEFVRRTNLVASAYSTSLYRFLYHDVPTVSLQVGRTGPDELITNELGLSLPIYDRATLRSTFASLELDAERERIRRRHWELTERGIFFSAGQATSRILELVQSFLEGSADA